MLRLAALFIAVLVLSPWAVGQHLLSGDWDSQTGEPLPLGGQAPEYSAPDGARGGGEPLEVLAHLAEGSTKLVRMVSDTRLVYQNGALLIGARLEGTAPTLSIVETARVTLPAQPSDAVLVGDLLYVSVRKTAGLHIYDVSSPDGFLLVGTFEGVDGLAIAVEGDRAYLGAGSAGVRILDVSNPAAPVLLGSFDTPGSANGLDVVGTTLYVADGNSASGPDFRIYDVTDPASAQALGGYEAGTFVTYVVVKGTTALLTGGFGITALDVSDPSNPTLESTLSLGGETTYEVVWDETIQNAYVVGLAGLFIVDTIHVDILTLLGAFGPVGQGLSLAVKDNSLLIMLADRFEGLRVIDADLVPPGPTELTRVDNGGFSHKGFFDDDYLYVTDLAGTLRIVDLGAAVPGGTGPVREVGRIDVPPNTQEVLVQDGIAYVSDADSGGSGLTILDVSDPANPTVLGSYGSSNQAFGMDLFGTTLCLANGFTGLQTLDVSDPTTPIPLDAFSMGSNTVDVDVLQVGFETYIAYAVNFGGGMYAIDASVPSDLGEIASQPSWGFLNALYLISDGAIGYVADGQQGLRVIDIPQPDQLVTLRTIPLASQARDVVGSLTNADGAFQEIGYVAEDFYGLRKFDANSGEALGQSPSADRGIGIALRSTSDDQRDLIALMGGETGVYLFDQPGLVENEPIPSESLALAAITPNPAQDGATVRYTLPDASPVRLAVYDVRGREVAVLAQGTQPSGAHEARFDTARLPSGVYVIRLQAGDRVLTTKATVVR